MYTSIYLALTIINNYNSNRKCDNDPKHYTICGIAPM